MQKFAKLFEFDDIGQVLVMLDTGDNGPEVRFSFMPEGLGVCSIALGFTQDDEDAAWDAAEEVFEKADSEIAHQAVVDALKTMPAGLAGLAK